MDVKIHPVPEFCQREPSRNGKLKTIRISRALCPGRKQAETRREELFADHFGGESARQIETAGSASEGKIAERLELGSSARP